MKQFLTHKNANFAGPIAEPGAMRHEVMRHQEPALHSYSPGIKIPIANVPDQGVFCRRRHGMTDTHDRAHTELFAALVGCELALNPNAFASRKTSAEHGFRRKENDSNIVVLGIAQTSSFAHGNGSGGQRTFGHYVAP